MARGMSLHIGVNRVDPAHYDGWDGALNACEFDANDMRAIAEGCGFETQRLLTAEATADAVFAASSVPRASCTVVTPSCSRILAMAAQVPDRNGEGEEDRSDETWLAFDREIVDDELYALWGKFAADVRIFVLSDSCHSGTVTRDIDGDVPDVVETREKAAAQSPRYRALPRDVMIKTYRAHADLYDGIQKQLPSSDRADPNATVLLISGCRDDQLSLDGFSNGLFTENLKAVWNEGAWQGGYAEFHAAIRSQMPDTQQPHFTRVGAENAEFEQQRPFTVG